MKKVFFLSLCLVFGLVLAANAQSGNMVTEERNIANFSGIDVAAGIDVYLTQSDNYSVKVKTDRRYIDRVETTVKNGKLTIRYANKNGRAIRNLETAVYVSMPEIATLVVSSGAEIKAAGVIRGDANMIVSASSAGEIKAIIDYPDVTISCSSGADVELKGRADVCVVDASSGADVEIDELECREITVKASSGADVSVFATQKLFASASSGADITYYGVPEMLNINKSSGGSVRQKK